VDPHRDYPEEPRWYGGDGGWDPHADVRPPEGRPDSGDYRVPEPRGADAGAPRYPGVEPRFMEPDPYGGPGGPGGPRFGETDPRGIVSDSSFPGFQPARLPPEAAGPGPVATPLAYPDPMVLPGGPPAADPAATAERPRALDLPTGPFPPPGPVPGEVTDQAPRYHAEPIDRAALRRPNGPVAPVGDGVYRTRRPALAFALATIVAVLEIPALRLLIEGAFGDLLSPSAIVTGTCLVLGLPAAGLGTYALVGGAGRTPDQSPAQAWFRAPLAYLGLGLVLLLAAALAAA
jgi:hypothetical protein